MKGVDEMDYTGKEDVMGLKWSKDYKKRPEYNPESHDINGNYQTADPDATVSGGGYSISDAMIVHIAWVGKAT